MRFVLGFVFVLGVAVPATACGPSTHGRPATTAEHRDGPVKPDPVGDADFGEATYNILLSGETDEKRLNLLAGVVRHQLERSKRRFANNRGAGLSALVGAVYLVRAGELRTKMFEGAAAPLQEGASEVARVGDEGRALAFYTLLRSVLPAGKDRDDVDAHLAALSRFSGPSPSAGPMRNVGDKQRRAANRSLIEPSSETLTQAKRATLDWISRGLDFSAAETPIRSNAEREEAVEAYRAVRAGGATLVALYLRHGDARGALEALREGDLLRIIPPGLTERLERAANDDDPSAWGDLYQLFEVTGQSDRPEANMDQQVGSAAAWGVSLELFRSEPRSMRGAAPLAAQLVDMGMAEVAPLVLVPALGDRPSAQELAWSLNLVLRAIVSEDELGDLAAARRTFTASKRLIEVAQSPAFAGKLRPGAGRLYYVMGALETRAGELARALPHVQSAVRAEPTLEAYGMLAAIERQRGNAERALSTLDEMAALAKKSGEPISEAEAAVTKFEIYRDRGDATRAQAELTLALRGALDARETSRSAPNQARAERLLARTLEHFGALQAARRATERAYEASRTDLRQLTATIIDASRRALLFGDLALARAAVRQAVEAGLAADDLVYVALWLRLVELERKVASDGTVEEALASIDDESGWASRLAAWGRGKLTDEQLVRAAKTRVQKTEGEFYLAMQKRNQPAGSAALEKIAKSEAIELVEVAIARDLLAKGRTLDLTLPANVKVP